LYKYKTIITCCTHLAKFLLKTNKQTKKMLDNTFNSIIDVAMLTIEPIIIVAAISLFIYSYTIDSTTPSPTAPDAGSVNHMDQSVQTTQPEDLCVHQITGSSAGDCTVQHLIMYIELLKLMEYYI
jgi:hypothetical protein